MQINIRCAVPGDNEKIHPLQEEIAKLHLEGRPDLFREEERYYTDEAFAQKIDTPDHFIFVAEGENNEIIGYAFANVIKYRIHSTYRDFDSFYIDDICVLEKYQRQGVGKLLFNRCLEQALSQKCHNIDLGVWSFNKNAIDFYKACGMNERLKRMELRLED